MKTISKTKEKIIFRGELSESLANAIRRYIFHIPVAAIDEVEISKNDSALYDETVAHRLGLVPLSMSNRKQGTLTLKGKKEGFVYSGELEGDFKVVYDKIPITLLNKGQELEIVATVNLGRGVDHAKYSPGMMTYRNVMDLKESKDVGEALEASQEIMMLRDKKDGEFPLADDYEGKYKTGKGKEGILIEPGKELIITVESFGQIDPESMFMKSVEELKKDIEEVSKAVSK